MPVPRVSSSTLPLNPRPAPNFISARPAAAASLVMATGRPMARPKSFPASQPMNLGCRFAEVRMREPCTTPGKPMPIGPFQAKCSAISRTIFAIFWGVTGFGVGTL